MTEAERAVKLYKELVKAHGEVLKTIQKSLLQLSDHITVFIKLVENQKGQNEEK